MPPNGFDDEAKSLHSSLRISVFPSSSLCTIFVFALFSYCLFSSFPFVFISPRVSLVRGSMTLGPWWDDLSLTFFLRMLAFLFCSRRSWVSRFAGDWAVDLLVHDNSDAHVFSPMIPLSSYDIWSSVFRFCFRSRSRFCFLGPSQSASLVRPVTHSRRTHPLPCPLFVSCCSILTSPRPWVRLRRRTLYLSSPSVLPVSSSVSFPFHFISSLLSRLPRLVAIQPLTASRHRIF